MSPVASGFVVPLMENLKLNRDIFAPDTLGNGDSSPLKIKKPEIIDFAEGLTRVLDSIGIKRAHFYGVRTGAMIASEVAINFPERVESLMIDELVPARSSAENPSIGEPCPEVNVFGSQLTWAWHVMRDHFIYHPWWDRYAQNRITLDLPSAELLHQYTTELLKAIRTFHFSYNAAQRWNRIDRLSLIRIPTGVFYEPAHEAFPDTRPIANVIPESDLLILPKKDTSQKSKAKLIQKWLTNLE
tara:strand:- start:151 stop:879 length:729 start_codon:yes stop_codon:yes gene_type:complete